MNKICAKCKIDKPLSEYSKLSRASDGLNYRCKYCCNSYYNSIYQKIKTKKSERSKIYYKENKDSILVKMKKSYNPEKKSQYNKLYASLNAESIRKHKNTYEKKQSVD